MKSQFPSLLISIPKGVLDLGWGHPSPRLHPNEILKTAAVKVLSQDSTPLQYGAIQGFGPLLESLTTFLSDDDSYRNCLLTPEHLFLTSGASQAIDFASTLFAEDGDTVFVEDPTYYLISSIFRDHRMNIIGVPTDHLGLDVDALEAMLSDNSIAKPKLLYTMPSFQNPTGAVMPSFRRKRLIELARNYDFLILADEVYQLLYYKSPPPMPLAGFDTSESGCVLSIGSFSKILAPGLRLGWIHAQPNLIERFKTAGMAVSGGGLNHFSSTLVQETLFSGLLRDNIEKLKDTYSTRVNTMATSLLDYPADFDYYPPTGGFFFWLTLKEEINTSDLLEHASKNGVLYRPGMEFSPSNSFTDSLRLSFTLYESDNLEEALKRLHISIEDYRHLNS